MKYRKNKLLALLLAALIASGNVSVSGADFMSDPEALALEEQIFSSDSSDSGADGFSDTNEDSEENFISDDPFIDSSSSSSPEPLETEKELLEESIEEPPAENEEAKDPADKINDFSSQEETPFSSGEFLPKKNTDYILGRPMTPEEIQEQLSLMGNSPSFAPMNNADSCLDISMYAVSDPYYDSRESGLITPVKNQNPFNICWAFSMASNFETSLLKKGLGSFDLSEEHLAYFFANRRNDPLGNTPEDKILHLKSDYHDGGNDRVASFFLSTWSGMVSEEKAPLPTNADHTANLSKPLDPALAYDTDAFLEDAVFSQYSVERMKLLLTEYGSVSALIHMDNKGIYYRPETAASCYPFSGNVNHAVTIVGWDDDYSKDNFPSASKVMNNGAWIVKNSYGASWGKEGYFYLSYEDASIADLVCNTAVSNPAYPNNYFYDGACTGTASVALNPGYSIANVYTASSSEGFDEELGEIVLASKQDFTSFQIQIYTDLTDSSNPVSGTPAFSSPMEYTQALAGIDTVPLETPVRISHGSVYSIVLTILDQKSSYYIELDTSAASGNWFSAKAGLAPGQSFFCTSANKQKWTDAYTKNYCFSIKAHTRNVKAAPAPTVTPRPTITPTPTVTPIPTAAPKLKTYGITYKTNTRLKTGNMPRDTASYTYGKSAKVKAAPYCTSRFFLGWNTRSDGRGISYRPGQTVQVKGNITLYAQWGVQYTSSRIIYRVNGKQTVTCYGPSSRNLKKVSIPSVIRYNGITYKVTEIRAKAFYKNSRLTTVNIGNNVAVIGEKAFADCKKLYRVNIGTGLKQINSHAFDRIKKGCVIKIKSTKLKKVNSRIDYGTSKMTVRVPRKKLQSYKKLFRKKSRTVTVKFY